MSAEPRIPSHRWYQKRRHVKLPRAYVDKSLIRAEGIAIIDGGAAPPPAEPPSNTQLPTLVLSSDNDTLTYGAGAWVGNPAPAVVARLFIAGVDTAAATTVMPVQAAWRGKAAQVRETATNTAGGPVPANSANVAIPAPPSLSAQVQAILAGTTGFALDPHDLSTMFQDAAGTIPVTAPDQPVGLIKGKWGTAAQAWVQSTAAARPVLQADKSMFFDGVDDFLNDNPNDIFQNVPAMFVCGRLVSLAKAIRTFLHLSGNVGGTPRFRFVSQTDGGLSFSTTRSGTTVLSILAPGASLTPGAAQTVTGSVNYAAAGLARLWIDGVLKASSASGGGDETEDLASSVARLMRFNTATNPGAGNWGRMVFCPFEPTDDQRATIEQWVKEVV
jgi:hypothetical protein